MDKISILEIRLLLSNGADELQITTWLPSGVWPYQGNQVVKMLVAAGSGEEYIRRFFPNTKYSVVSV